MKEYPALSYTAIKLYELCPFRFFHEKIAKTVPYVQSEEAAKGDRIHKEFEAYIKSGGKHTLSDEASPWQGLLYGLLQKPGDKFCETKMCLDWKCRQVDYFKGRDIWLRGQFDLMIKQGDTASIVDYKTGSSRYPDLDQLELMSAMAFLHFPDLNTVNARLLFIKDLKLVMGQFVRDKLPAYIETWKQRSVPIVQACETKDWKAKPNNLCGYCPITDCRHHPKMKGGMT